MSLDQLGLGTNLLHTDRLDDGFALLDAWRAAGALGTLSTAHLAEAVAAATIQLSDPDLRWLEDGEGTWTH